MESSANTLTISIEKERYIWQNIYEINKYIIMYVLNAKMEIFLPSKKKI